MSAPISLTASDQELLGQMARFAERMAGEGGVYYNRGYSVSLGKFVVTLIAIGNAAEMVDKLVTKPNAPRSNLIEVDTNNDKW